MVRRPREQQALHQEDTPAHRAAVAEWTDRIDAVLDMYLDVRLAA